MTDPMITAAEADGPLTPEEIHRLLRRTLLACALIALFVAFVEVASAIQ